MPNPPHLAAAVVAAAALTLGAPAQADRLGLDLQTGGASIPCGGCGPSGTTFGWSFSLVTAATVDGLGVWDAGSDGLGTPTPVGLWNSAGTLLASTSVTDSSTRVASASADGSWLFESIAALALAPGDYVLGNVFFSDAPLLQSLAPFVTDPAVTNVVNAAGPGNAGFAFPGDELIAFPIFGPTLRLSDPAFVSEAAGVALFGIALAAMLVSRRGR